MAPVNRGPQRQSSPSRRAATPPAQQRRTAAAKPTRRQAATAVAEPEEDETTAFDASADSETTDEPEEYDEDNLPEVIDLSGVKPATFEVVPRGWYDGYIDAVEYGLSQSKNLPMLTWILKFDFGEDEETGDPKERTLRWYTTLAGEGLPRTVASLQRLDPELDMEKFAPEEMDELFGGMEVRIHVTIRPDRENRKIKRNNVADVVPLNEEE